MHKNRTGTGDRDTDPICNLDSAAYKSGPVAADGDSIGVNAGRVDYDHARHPKRNSINILDWRMQGQCRDDRGRDRAR